MNELISKGHDLFKDCGFTYYICGGFALELFVGKEMRPHSDLDISIFHEDRHNVVDFLQRNGWRVYKRVFEPGSWGGITPIVNANDPKLDDIRNIWAMKKGSHLNPKLREGEDDLYDFEILSKEQVDFNFIEMVLDNKENGGFVCNKSKTVVRELDKTILYTDCGVPYLAPEIILFLKSSKTYTTHEWHKGKTPGDFKAVMPLLPDESKKWLINALNAEYPDGYEWLEDILVGL